MAEIVAETERLISATGTRRTRCRFYAIMNTPAVMRHLGGAPDARWLASMRVRADAPSTSANSATPSGSSRTKQTANSSAFAALSASMRQARGDLDGHSEIGWRLRESAWGQGYAKEAADRHARPRPSARFGYDQVIAMTIPPNARKPGADGAPRHGATRRPRLHRSALRARGQSADRLRTAALPTGPRHGLPRWPSCRVAAAAP